MSETVSPFSQCFLAARRSPEFPATVSVFTTSFNRRLISNFPSKFENNLCARNPNFYVIKPLGSAQLAEQDPIKTTALMDHHSYHNPFERRNFIKSKTPTVKWFKEW